jgi:hypothetical protein
MRSDTWLLGVLHSMYRLQSGWSGVEELSSPEVVGRQWTLTAVANRQHVDHPLLLSDAVDYAVGPTTSSRRSRSSAPG